MGHKRKNHQGDSPFEQMSFSNTKAEVSSYQTQEKTEEKEDVKTEMFLDDYLKEDSDIVIKDDETKTISEGTKSSDENEQKMNSLIDENERLKKENMDLRVKNSELSLDKSFLESTIAELKKQIEDLNKKCLAIPQRKVYNTSMTQQKGFIGRPFGMNESPSWN